MIALQGVTKVYGTFVALQPLDLAVRPGELFGFLGPNGAGKTTTIRILTGLLRPSGGSVRVAGFDLLGDPRSVKRLVGYVPDRPYLYEKLTPIEYFRFLAGLFEVAEDEAVARGEGHLAYFGLTPWKDELIEGFSHGMRQKVAVCAALLHQPKVLVIDEPTVGLDPRSVRLFKDLLRSQSAAGVTVFLSTHNLTVAEDLCQRIAIINQGRCAALGTMPELKALSRDPRLNLEEIFLRLVEEGDGVVVPQREEAPLPPASR